MFFGGLIAILLILLSAVPDLRSNELVLGWVGSAWALCSFLQAQELERTRFFFDLFNRFNERYNALNDDLDRIVKQEGPLNKPDRQKVVDYFNLCAEEFMFYSRGYIPEDVWRAWRNGMRYYQRTPRIVTAWREERGTDSHYGFDFEDI